MDFKKEILNLLKSELKLNEIHLEIPSNSRLGDYSLPCFKLGKNPSKESIKLKNKIKKPNFISDIKSIGPYLNFYIDDSKLAKQVLTECCNSVKNNNSIKKNKKTVIIESPGPNTNKPLHLGHVRNMLLGNSIYNLNKLMGNDVSRVDIINDRGIHICKSMLAYKKFGKNKKPNKKTDHFVGDYYIKYTSESKKNKNLEKELSKILIKWEEKDKETRKLWKIMNKWAIKGIKETYKRYGTKIDKYYFESNHYLSGKKIVLKGLKNKIFQKDKSGNIIANLEKEGLDKKVVLRADGTSIYITQDIALAEIRNKEYNMDEMIYISANEQEYHFKALFHILRKLKYSFTKNFHHLAYGYISLPEGRMKSREGKVIEADDLADKMKDLAKKEIKKRNKELSEKQIGKISEQIGMGAIKFFMLKYDPLKNFTYKPNESIKFEGETGPYTQYTVVRINSILKKSKINKDIDFSLFNEESEMNLIKKLSKYNEIIAKSTKEYKPSLLCNFIISLCKEFNAFYQNCNVLENKNKKITSSRIFLTACVGQVLKEGLAVLSIEIPIKM